MDVQTAQLNHHLVLTIREEQILAQRIEDARQTVAITLGRYLPTVQALLEKYQLYQTGAAQLRDYIQGLHHQRASRDSFGPAPAEAEEIPISWIKQLDRLQVLMKTVDPDSCHKVSAAQWLPIWNSIRLHPIFLNLLVEDFIRDVEERNQLESRLGELCRQRGCSYPASVKMLRRLSVANNNAGRAAKQLLESVTSSGFTNRRLRTLQCKVVLALTRLHKEKSRLIAANQRLVTSIARPFAHTGISIQDLIQEGNLGLMRAADGFDLRRGYKFSTYAVWWIRRAVVRAVSAQRGPMHIPFQQDLSLHKIEKARNLLTQQLGRAPELMELATQSGVDPKRIRQLQQIPRSTVSGQTGTAATDFNPLDLLTDPNPTDPGDSLDQSSICKELEQTLDKLPSMQALVLRMRFGIGLHQDYTLAHIGRQFGLSRERIRQIEAEALASLRELADQFPLRAYVDEN